MKYKDTQKQMRKNVRGGVFALRVSLKSCLQNHSYRDKYMRALKKDENTVEKVILWLVFETGYSYGSATLGKEEVLGLGTAKPQGIPPVQDMRG